MATRIANPLALAVLALLFERPMHPYEMAATMKERHKEDSIKLRYGSLYTVIDMLLGAHKAPGNGRMTNDGQSESIVPPRSWKQRKLEPQTPPGRPAEYFS